MANIHEQVVIFLSPGVAAGAGGWAWTPKGIRKVPSNNPEAFQEAHAGVALLDLAERTREPQLGAELKSMGEKLLTGAAKQIAAQTA